MRPAILPALLTTVIVGTASSGGSAQTIVDLSKPQPGTSRFVLNADLTPATLGVVEAPKARPPVVAASNVPACGEGCKMTQPEVQRSEERRPGFMVLPGASPFDQERTRAYVTQNALAIHNATKPEERRRFRGRRR